MKVLMLLHNLRVSAGVSSYVMNYFRAIDHSKIQMDFAIWRDIPSPYYEEIRKAGSKVFILPPIKKIAKHIEECERIISSEKYDVIHDNTLLISYPIMYVAQKYGVPVRLLHSHNSKLGETKTKELRNKIFIPLLKMTATDYAACSGLAAKAMFGSNQYNLIPNIIMDQHFEYSEERRSFIRHTMGIDNKIIIGSVGRLAIQKNPLFALDVFKALLKTNPRLEYWWIGSGPLDQAFNDRIKELGLDRQVRAMGSRDDVVDLYQAMDIFFMPSVFEGFGIVAVEAQTMGLPTIVSDVVPHEVMFTDLVKFISIDKGPDNCARELEQQIKDIKPRRGYLYELGKSPFSCKNAGEHLLSLYNKMIVKKTN